MPLGIFSGKFQPFLGSLFQKAFPLLQDMFGSKVICKVRRFPLSFVVSFAQDFQILIKTFETNAPLIRIGYFTKNVCSCCTPYSANS